jgi:hypothetical protein
MDGRPPLGYSAPPQYDDDDDIGTGNYNPTSSQVRLLQESDEHLYRTSVAIFSYLYRLIVMR